MARRACLRATVPAGDGLVGLAPPGLAKPGAAPCNGGRAHSVRRGVPSESDGASKAFEFSQCSIRRGEAEDGSGVVGSVH